MTLELPQELSEKQIEEFKGIYQKTYGEELGDKDARLGALRLIQIIYLIHLREID